MPASLRTFVRVAREMAYGVDTLHALKHGARPSAPPYATPVFSGAPGSATATSGASAHAGRRASDTGAGPGH